MSSIRNQLQDRIEELERALDDFAKAFVLRMGATAAGDYERFQAADKMLWTKYEKARTVLEKGKVHEQ
jgi:hypothetical protein